MHMLMEHLGSPQNGLRCVHVAGTKGKGSTAAFIESILLESGYSVGLYTRYVCEHSLMYRHWCNSYSMIWIYSVLI